VSSGSQAQAVRPLLWACAAFAGGVLLHIDRVPLWASAAALALIVWRVLRAHRPVRILPVAVRALLALALIVAVLLRYHTLNGLAAGTALLTLMGAVKLLETRSARDQAVLVGAGLFLLLAACLDRQELARAPLYVLHAWICCAALAVITSSTLTTRAALSLSGRALLLAAPLAALLFVFFPRLPGAFWALPRGEEATTGLSDTMSPGSIAHLASSYDVAFRARFSGPLPPPAQRYWRGPVLHDFDGFTWRRRGAPYMSAHTPLAGGSAYHYQITLEPTRQRWWFALDTPIRTSDPKVWLSYDFQLIAPGPITQPVSFEADSYTEPVSAGTLGYLERSEDTFLPRGRNPRSLELSQSLRQGATSDAAVVTAALDFLRRGGFQYTVDPQPLGEDSVDDLLFGTRAGFCSHYASAFVTLMRGAGIPSRVVTGYLGGEWNPVGQYFEVHQADAHAWAEVWLPGRGWTRVDPTAVVAPERLQHGIIDLLPNALSAPVRLLHRHPWLAGLLQRWDAVNDWWGSRVVKFNYDTQLDLLARFGVRSPDAYTLGWAFGAALLGWLALSAWRVGQQLRAPRRDPLAAAYLRLCRKLARVVPVREPHQGPLSFADTVAEHRPDLAAAVRALLERYAQLRYGAPQPATRARDVQEFSRAVARLSLSQ
jgi:protein-glutamine gamma-glutamyltransferase